MDYLISSTTTEGSDQIKDQDYYTSPAPDFAVFTSHFQSGSDVRISIATADPDTVITGVAVEAARPRSTSATANQITNIGKTWTGTVTTGNGATSARLRVTLDTGNTFAVNVDLP